jgi:hypothetical protein
VQDLARFAAALDDRSAIAVPRPETRPIPTRAGYRYWYVHTGALPGAYSILRRDWDGAHFTAACGVFDRRTGDGAVDGTISDELASAAAQVAAWPAGPDLLTGDAA